MITCIPGGLCFIPEIPLRLYIDAVRNTLRHHTICRSDNSYFISNELHAYGTPNTLSVDAPEIDEQQLERRSQLC